MSLLLAYGCILELTFIRWGNLNGVVSSNIYRQKDSPLYRPGHGTVLGYLVLFLLGGSIVTTLGLRGENKKRAEGKRDARLAGLSPKEIEMLGDKRPDFVYTV